MEADRYIGHFRNICFEGLSEYESMGVDKNLWLLRNKAVVTS
jgi:hypothetical protein